MPAGEEKFHPTVNNKKSPASPGFFRVDRPLYFLAGVSFIFACIAQVVSG